MQSETDRKRVRMRDRGIETGQRDRGRERVGEREWARDRGIERMGERQGDRERGRETGG